MAGALRKVPLFTFEAFLGFYEWCPDNERWELIDGHPVMMNPPALRHQAIVKNIVFYLESIARQQDVDWEVLDGIGVHNPEDVVDSALIPDVSVAPSAPLEGSYRSDLIVLFEVISPGTKRRDRGWKKAYYQRLPRLQHYVIVDQDRIRAELFSREQGWHGHIFDKPEDHLRLSAIGIDLPVREICRRTGLL